MELSKDFIEKYMAISDKLGELTVLFNKQWEEGKIAGYMHSPRFFKEWLDNMVAVAQRQEHQAVNLTGVGSSPTDHPK